LRQVRFGPTTDFHLIRWPPLITLALPDDAVASIGPAPYAAGVKPYLPLLPPVTDRHVDAFTLGGTVDEIVAHAAALRRAGIDSILIRPLAPHIIRSSSSSEVGSLQCISSLTISKG
jgi:hypothetical protein